MKRIFALILAAALALSLAGCGGTASGGAAGGPPAPPASTAGGSGGSCGADRAHGDLGPTSARPATMSCSKNLPRKAASTWRSTLWSWRAS